VVWAVPDALVLGRAVDDHPDKPRPTCGRCPAAASAATARVTAADVVAVAAMALTRRVLLDHPARHRAGRPLRFLTASRDNPGLASALR
jgi:hypothetical protein